MRFAGKPILDGGDPNDDADPPILELSEVDFTATRKELRKLGEFLIEASKHLRKDDHWHFQKFADRTPELVVMRPPRKEHMP